MCEYFNDANNTRIKAKIVDIIWKKSFWFDVPFKNVSGHGKCVIKSTILI